MTNNTLARIQYVNRESDNDLYQNRSTDTDLSAPLLNTGRWNTEAVKARGIKAQKEMSIIE